MNIYYSGPLLVDRYCWRVWSGLYDLVFTQRSFTCRGRFRDHLTFLFFFQVDFEQLSDNLIQLERKCKISWDNLKVLAKHETKPQLKNKITEFLKDCTERIIILKVVHRRIINRSRKHLVIKLFYSFRQELASDKRPELMVSHFTDWTQISIPIRSDIYTIDTQNMEVL